MRIAASQWGVNLFFIALISFMIIIAMNPGVFSNLGVLDNTLLQSFKTMFISIFLEAFPFILFGVLISSFMQIFVSEQWIRKWVPSNPILGILFGCLLGIIFPMCECGLIPVVRRLIAKGVPLYVGVVFIIVGPIVNPIVYAATYTAFRTKPAMLYSRMGLALAVGAVIGFLVHQFVRKNQLRNSRETMIVADGASMEHSHTRGGRLLAMVEHAGSEFFETGKFLIFGSMITAAIQAYVPRGSLVDLGHSQLGSPLFMMGLAYIMSLCSTSDAFVASSFANTFSSGSLIAFMVFGPMLDFKGSLMLLSVFKTKFVLLLALLIFALVFTGSILIQSHVLHY
ncbi:permease [Paenibacillus cremeus]|uniref:Permease n=1 Tax=Paenibacillus cremeus TaxID=2163881 RepID=A0A559K434_9BACL|nr:permease [Paenibacillus cremeus]TVY06903.1 permease [Paenibacillus cremeus]